MLPEGHDRRRVAVLSVLSHLEDETQVPVVSGRQRTAKTDAVSQALRLPHRPAPAHRSPLTFSTTRPLKVRTSTVARPSPV